VTVAGVVVKEEGVALSGLFTSFNFIGSNVTATNVGGVATITVSSAPPDATFIVQTPSSNLSAEQSLSTLATGLLKNTTATGVLSIATAADLPGSIPLSKLDITGTPDGTKFLRDDSSWQAVIPPAWGNITGALSAQTDLQSALDAKQPLDADLTAIAALSGTSGLLSKTGANTWSLDTNTYATRAYADSLVVGLLDDRGNYDASGNAFPSSGGSGSAGAILKGDLWTISVAGTLGGVAVTAGDVVRALVDTPGQTSSNWAIGENNFGYVALNQALADGKIYVGNVSGIGTAVTPSGDVTISNTGVFTIGAAKVTNAMLAGSIDLTSKVTGRFTFR
jgi:hypothetical protein